MSCEISLYLFYPAISRIALGLSPHNEYACESYLGRKDYPATTLLSPHHRLHTALTSKMAHNASARMAFQPSAETHLIAYISRPIMLKLHLQSLRKFNLIRSNTPILNQINYAQKHNRLVWSLNTFLSISVKRGKIIKIRLHIIQTRLHSTLRTGS